MRLNRVRNEREQRALQHEIELAKIANQQMENEVIDLMEQLEALQEALKQANERQEEFHRRYEQELSLREETMARLQAEVEEAYTRRRQLMEEIDPELLQRYEQIRARRGGLAVAEVRAAICLGCNMNLPPQFYNELIRGDDIRLCPNCNRILIWRGDMPSRMLH
jgi:predicted  nucleic acid-binding Zn-ribbon protein